MEEIDMTNLSKFQKEFTNALRGRHSEDQETQEMIDRSVKERLDGIDWEKEARIEPALLRIIRELGFVFRKYPEVGLEIDYEECKNSFVGRLQHILSICTYSREVYQSINELLEYSQKNDWDDSVIRTALKTGYIILSSYFTEHGT
ncbi:hypothetical protein ACFLY9_01020 [Patescibacteria group bacterium]